MAKRTLVKGHHFKILKNSLYLSLCIILILVLALSSNLIVAIHTEIKQNEVAYKKIMREINAPENRSLLLKLYFNERLSYLELLDWVSRIMTWVPIGEDFERFETPFLILENGTGRGRCGEYSIVYAAACLAHGYDARIVTEFIVGDHAWVELLIDDRWVHINPSPTQKIDQPLSYWEKCYLFVYGYQTDGKVVYLSLNYNPVLTLVILIALMCIGKKIVCSIPVECYKIISFFAIILLVTYFIVSNIFPEPPDTHQPTLDYWTIMHFMVALIFGFFFDSISLALSGILGWEVWEVLTKTEEWITSIPNNLFDIFIGLCGYTIGRHLPRRELCPIGNICIMKIKKIHDYICKQINLNK